MLFTVVTPALNCGDLIERNILSVASQFKEDRGRLEHWVIDGGSKDATVDILRRYPEVRWLSEPDRGLSNAVNKGIERAGGEWILWVNADDTLEPNALNRFLELANTDKGKLFSSDLRFRGYGGNEIGVVPGRAYTFEGLTCGRFDINQPGTVVHRTVYEDVGLLDESYRFAMDYEWLVRAVRKYECVHLPVTMACYYMREESLMDANMAAHYRAFARVRRKYGLPRLSRVELRIWAYIFTDWFRKKKKVRACVRSLKKFYGIDMPMIGE